MSCGYCGQRAGTETPCHACGEKGRRTPTVVSLQDVLKAHIPDPFAAIEADGLTMLREPTNDVNFCSVFKSLWPDEPLAKSQSADFRGRQVGCPHNASCGLSTAECERFENIKTLRGTLEHWAGCTLPWYKEHQDVLAKLEAEHAKIHDVTDLPFDEYIRSLNDEDIKTVLVHPSHAHKNGVKNGDKIVCWWGPVTVSTDINIQPGRFKPRKHSPLTGWVDA